MAKPSFREEKKLWEKGYRYVIGVDEVGRGAFTGPVTVGAVVFKKDTPCTRSILAQVNDSKLIKPRKREELAKYIKTNALFFSIADVPVSKINKFGIGKATQIAFRKVLKEALEKLNDEKVFVLIDGFHVKYIKKIGLGNQKAIIRGDQKSISIAAASILAKVHRDSLMKKLSKKYPSYRFSKNKGYGTKEHQLAIKKYGLSRIHRKSFNLGKFTQ